MPDPRDEERKPPTNPWLERVEWRCAQAWACAYYAIEQSVLKGSAQEAREKFDALYQEMLDWKRAWIQIKELRYGRIVEFHYNPPNSWRTVAPGVAVKP